MDKKVKKYINKNFTHFVEMKTLKRIMNKFEVTGMNDCWEPKPHIVINCTGQIYGCKIDYKPQNAERIIFQCLVEEIPYQMIICRTCDTEHCGNPTHYEIRPKNYDKRAIKGDNIKKLNKLIKKDVKPSVVCNTLKIHFHTLKDICGGVLYKDKYKKKWGKWFDDHVNRFDI